jgi:hypothetical protein
MASCYQKSRQMSMKISLANPHIPPLSPERRLAAGVFTVGKRKAGHRPALHHVSVLIGM